MLRSKPFLRTPLGLLVGLLFLLGGCVDFGPTGPSPDGSDGMRLNNEVGVQSTFNGYIRIGVVPSATTVRIGAAGAFTIKNKTTGATLFTGSDGEATVNLLTSGTVDTRMWLQTACASAASRDNWLARAAALGYETRTEFVPAANCWRLQLGTLDQGWTARVNFKNQAISDGLAGTDSFWTSVTIVYGDTQLQLAYNGSRRNVDAPVVLTSDDGIVTINGLRYRGLAEVWTNSGGTLAGINELPIEQYLYGVVPNELPPVPYGEPEAQKAQAVTARTYAIANLGKRRTDGYDLLPTTSDQVYRGFSTEHPVSTAAVDGTTGVVAVSGGRLISTLYHSTSGGFTANSEDVYTNYFSYLRGVPDAERGQALENVPTIEVFKRAANPINLRAAAEGDFESDWSRYHRWTVEWTAAEMTQILSATFNTTVTQVFAINVTDRADHGRVRRIEFLTDAGTLVGLKDQIRSRLQYFTSTGARASLRSTLFYIEPVTDPRTRAITGWKAWGGGWGHGVGMSQTGAVGMAERGRTYDQILRHYYQGIALETRQY